MEVDDIVTQQVEEAQAALEALEPLANVPAREITFRGWVLPDGRELAEKKYTQAPLGMFPTQEFTTITTAILNNFIQGEQGLRIGELFRGEVKMPDDFTPDVADKLVEDNIELIKAFIKLFEIFPEYQKDVIALSLGVRRGERNWFKECIELPPHMGGLTLEDGIDIIIIFIKQNARMIRRVAVGKAQELIEVFMVEVLDRKPDSTEETEAISSTAPTPIPVEPPTTPGSTPSSTSSPATPASV